MERWALYAMRFMYCVYYRHVFQRLSYISTGRGWVVFVVYINKENERMQQKNKNSGPLRAFVPHIRCIFCRRSSSILQQEMSAAHLQSKADNYHQMGDQCDLNIHHLAVLSIQITSDLC